MSEPVAFQDDYPDDVAHCYGCGRLNSDGLHVRSFWDSDGEGTIARLLPDEKYLAIPGYVYGGLIASFIDCHGTGSAAAAMARRDSAANRPEEGTEGRDSATDGRAPATESATEQATPAERPMPRFVTASLQVDYRAPTPMGVELVARGAIVEITDRKVVTDITLQAGDVTVATGRVIAVRMPEGLAD